MEARASLRQTFSASAIGSPKTARRQVEDFVNRTQPDELMVAAQIFDHSARLRSYELFTQSVRQPSGL